MNGESDCHALWQNGIQALGAPGAATLKKDFAPIFERFNKVYVHNEGDQGGKTFMEKACRIIPYDKLYIVSARAVSNECKDPSDLNIKGLLESDTFLATAEPIDKNYYDEVNSTAETGQDNDFSFEEPEQHVRISQEIMQRMYIHYYKEEFYVYSDGVYRRNRNAVEKCILSIEPNSKRNLRNEVLEYLRINTFAPELEVNEQYINFKNGLFDLVNKRLIEHSPNYFTTCQIHANYLEDKDILVNKDIEDFLRVVTCGDLARYTTLLQAIGYSMTFRVNLSTAFFFYGPSANNGKSTTIELINTLIGPENICHITMAQLSDRFTGSELTDKLLNTETEVEKDVIRNIETFKKIITGDEFSVEEKYHPRYNIKPFCKFIFGTNNLPRLEEIADEGFYRRLNIIPFCKKISKEEEINFDKSKILTQEALDYLANIALREYLKIANTRELANKEENNKIINKYRRSNNSTNTFLNDVTIIDEIFEFDNRILKTAFYAKYVGWCKENNFFIQKKSLFYEQVSADTNYIEKTIDGKDFFENINKKSRKELDIVF